MRSTGRYRHRERAAASAADRRCSRNGCQALAVATLTYVYAASTAVVGPLAVHPEPHTYDLCVAHARSLTAPRGWELVRQDGELAPPPPPRDDLTALAEAVREAGHPVAGQPTAGAPTAGDRAAGERATGEPPSPPRPDPPRPRRRESTHHLRLVPPV